MKHILRPVELPLIGTCPFRWLLVGYLSTPWRVEWLYCGLPAEWIYKFSFLELRVRYLRHTRIPKVQESKSHIISGYVSSKSHNSAIIFSARECCSGNCDPLSLSGLEKQPYTTLMVASPKPHPFIMIVSGNKNATRCIYGLLARLCRNIQKVRAEIAWRRSSALICGYIKLLLLPPLVYLNDNPPDYKPQNTREKIHGL
jgi:hypothetical protein